MFLIKKIKESSDLQLSNEKQPCYLAQLPQDIQSHIALFCYINDCKEHPNTGVYMHENGGLYKINPPLFGLISNDKLLWQDPQAPNMFKRSLLILPIQYELLEDKGVYVIKKIIPNLKASGRNGQKIFIVSKQVVGIFEQLSMDGEIQLATASLDGNYLFTIEQNFFNRKIQSSSLIIRKKKDNLFSVDKTIALPLEEKYKCLSYIDALHTLGLLKEDNKTVKLISLKNELGCKYPDLNECFSRKGVCKNLSSSIACQQNKPSLSYEDVD